MPHDAIIGARFMDTVFNSEFTIVSVRAETDTNEIPEPEDITVMIEYSDRMDNRIIEFDLDEFRNLDDIYVIEVPEHAQ